MSAAAYALLDDRPTQQDDVPRRRPSGARLYRRMVSDSELAYRLSDPEIVPIGGELVLKAVAKLIAASPDGETYPLNPGFNPGGFERRLVLALKKIGRAAEEQVRTLLGALVSAELVERTDDAVRLRLPPEREATRRRVGLAGRIGPEDGAASGRIGRPRLGETPDEYAARKLDAQNRAAQRRREQGAMDGPQRALPMPPVAVAGMSGEGRDLPRDFSQDLNPTFGLSPVSPEVGIRSGLPLDFPHAVGVVVKNSDRDSRDLTPTTTPTAHEADFPRDLDKSGENKSRAEKSDFPAADLSDKTISPVQAQAEQLRGVVARGLDLDPSATAKSLAVILGWLNQDKAPPDVLLAEFHKGIEFHRRERAAGGRGITSVNWFAKPVGAALQALRARDAPPYSRPEPGSGPASSSAALDPSLAAVPAWAAAPAAVQSGILWLLKTMARPPGADRASRLRSIRTRDQAAFDLVAAQRPELLTMVEDESG